MYLASPVPAGDGTASKSLMHYANRNSILIIDTAINIEFRIKKKH